MSMIMAMSRMMLMIHMGSCTDPYRIHLRTLSSGLAHPSAVSPHLLYDHPGAELQLPFGIAIFGETLAIVFSCLRADAWPDDRAGMLIVWNWKTGIERAVSGNAKSWQGRY